uniref:Large ribosomal subunit protein bL19m n=1 Tax=Evadne anonyx TaxID=141404 RepID=A0A9N6ZF92_9CRUS|nr:EOG090X0F2L [Evadne anonyx]
MKFIGLVQSLLKRNLSSVNELAATAEATEKSNLQKTENKDAETVVPPEYRFIYPEFLPEPAIQRRNRLGERLERMDMIQRRSAIEIPEFYSGSILAITVTDSNAPNKVNRFLGICIQKGGVGLRAWAILRNVIDNQGVEILYQLYCPLIVKVEVMRLEKRLDDSLLYLRDALPEYSTFDFNMEPEIPAENSLVPINPLKVVLKPRPWLERWERQELQGVEDLNLKQEFYDRAEKQKKPWEKYDLMLQYRNTIPAEEQEKIFKEVHYHLQQQADKRKQKMRRGTSAN